MIVGRTMRIDATSSDSSMWKVNAGGRMCAWDEKVVSYWRILGSDIEYLNSEMTASDQKDRLLARVYMALAIWPGFF